MNLMGKKVRDQITGFEGVASAYVKYLTGCNQYLVSPKVDADGKMKEGAWIDEQRLVANEDEPAISLDNAAAGCMEPPPQR